MSEQSESYKNLDESEDNNTKPDTSLSQDLITSVKELNISDIVSILLTSYLFYNCLSILTKAGDPYELNFIESFSLLNFTFIMISVCYIVITFRTFSKSKDIYYYLLILSSIVYSLIIISVSPKDIFFSLIVCVIVAFITYFSLSNIKEEISIHINRRVWYALFIAVFLLFTIILSIATVSRYRIFHAPTYDFGIFVQMFESMKSIGLPLTTVERGYELSHFAIHFSPIYYILLPGYFIFPNPDYLLIMQTVIVFSGILPIFLLTRLYKFTLSNRVMISITYLSYPAVLTAQFYDFHEALFMAPLLLWLLYFYESKKFSLMYISLFLTLLVKEDAAIYLIFIGLFLLLNKKDLKHGVIIIITSLSSFYLITYLMTLFGHGIMENRLTLFLLPGQSGIITFFSNMAKNPTFTLRQFLDSKKFIFTLYMLGPLVFLPLITQKYSRFILIAPFLIINLLTNYPYQYEIGYQYTFASGALLFFLFIINLNDVNDFWKRTLVILSLTFSLILMLTSTNNRLFYYTDVYMKNSEYYDESHNILDAIPRDAVVFSEDFLTPHLGQVSDLYVIPTNIDLEPDFVILYSSHDIETDEYLNTLFLDYSFKLESSNEFVSIYIRE